MTSEQLEAYLRARDGNQCQRRNRGCTHTCDLVELALTVEELRALRRDPNSPDNWLCSCRNCSRTEP